MEVERSRLLTTNRKSEPKAEAANNTRGRIFAKMLREGLRQASEAFTGRAAATGRSSAANLLQNPKILSFMAATATRSAKLQRRELCVAIVLEAGLCCEKLGRGGIAIFAGLSGFDPLRVDACADSSVR